MSHLTKMEMETNYYFQISQNNPDITSRNLEDEVDKTLLRASILKLNDREKNIMEMMH